MSEHYRTLSAVFPIIIKTARDCQEVLLHKRENTGFMDRMWDFAGSGHVDENETAREAVVRECKEEIGIIINTEDISFAHLSHRIGRNGARTYYDIYFAVTHFQGTPYITEPDKCSDLKWFNVRDLPSDMIEMRKTALENYLQSIYYSEIY